MKQGDNVMISPDLTHLNEWVRGTVIEVKQNPFVGVVIVAKTDEGVIYFEREDMFKLAEA
jgi:NOL1/NOP2/fmu family ribosome biogenesis protein